MLFIVVALALFSCRAAAADLAAPRTAWTTSQITGTPEPPLPYIAVRLRPDLAFKQPTDLVRYPDGKRMVITENRATSIHLIDLNSPDAPPLLLADMKQFNREAADCYSIAFHPKFAENRLVFVWFNLGSWPNPNRDHGTQIVRFQMTKGDSPRIDLTTGKTIITFISGGHNGGSLRFGPDGFLYISIGDSDAPDPPDSKDTGQDLSDLSSSILRIDIDHEEAGRPYRIPADNPFVKLKDARGEIWAYGLRNPWRMSFDPNSGALYAGDVGWELWEAIYEIKRGGNYGWPITEMSRQPVKPHVKRGPTPILEPLVVHSHEESASITGGETYQGKSLPELRGAHIYGDFETGRLWAFHPSKESSGQRTIKHLGELCDTTAKIIGFAIDHEGELLFADYGGGGIYRLARNPDQGKASNFPRKLSETGLFADVAKHAPAAGVVPYAIRTPRWADHATAERLLALPGASVIDTGKNKEGAPGAGKWTFPKDSVLTKTYTLEMERGNPQSARRIETQMLHYTGEAWNTYTYRWNDQQTDAVLVGPNGDSATFNITDPTAKDAGGLVTQKQTWRFFSRAECQRCHTNWTNYTPSFNSAQLLRGSSESPLSALDGCFSHVPPRAESKLVSPHDSTSNLESRARSYLHANCGTCHRFGGGGSVPSFFNIEESLKNARILDAFTTQGTLDLPEARIVAPADPYRSTLLFRMTTTGRGHMPYLGGRLIDEQAIVLMRDWIASMPVGSPVSEATVKQRTHEMTQLKKLRDGDANSIDELLQSSSGSLSLALALADRSVPMKMRQPIIERGSRLADPLRRDLFERFLPAEKRRIVLGDAIDVNALLAIKGDAARGRTLFFQQGGAQCSSCHRIDDQGTTFGPDLSKIATKYKRGEIIEHILAPSKLVDPAWKLTILEMNDGTTHSGFITQRTAKELTMTITGGKEIRIAVDQIEGERASNLTAMPEGLLANLTAQEAADLIAFLTR